MKNYLSLGIILLILAISKWTAAQSHEAVDSIMEVRQDMQRQYEELISSTRESPQTDQLVFDLQNRIIATDNILLQEHLGVVLNDFDSISDVNLEKTQLYEELERENSLLKRQQEELSTISTIVTISLGVLIIVLIVVIIVFVKRIKKLKKITQSTILPRDEKQHYEKKIKELEEKLAKKPSAAANDTSEIKELRKTIEEYEKKAGENHIKIIQLKSEKQKLEEQLRNREAEQLPKNQTDKTHVTNNRTDSELLILEHQLSEARANLEDLTEKNKMIAEELTKLIEQEKNAQNENQKLQNETEELKKQKQDLIQQLENAPVSNQEKPQSIKAIQEHEMETNKLKKKIDIYEQRLRQEEKLRIRFEKEVYQIIDDFKEQIRNMQ